MPPSTAEQREDKVISLLVADLMRLGRTAAVLDRPDRNADRTDGLTVDAELALLGAVFAGTTSLDRRIRDSSPTKSLQFPDPRRSPEPEQSD
jgi:hypothetical protein